MNIGDNAFGGIVAHIFTEKDEIKRYTHVFDLCYITGMTIAISGTTGSTRFSHYYQIFNTGETHGFVVSSIDIGESIWGCDSYTGSSGVTVGLGYENSSKLLNCDAAILCKNYTGGDYTDWILPSNDDAMMFCPLHWAGFGNFTTGETGIYLTSTEIDCQRFGNCYNPDYKDYKLCFTQNVNHDLSTWPSDMKYPEWRTFGAFKKDIVAKVRAIRYF